MALNPKIRNKFSTFAREPFVSTAPDRTQQHLRDEVNINNIIAKYNKTGIIEHVTRNRLKYGEFADLADYATNLDKVAKAQQSFETLPATLRNEFKNSIEGFFEFIRKPENKEQCVKWGIFDPPKDPKPAAPAAGEPSPQSTKTGKIKAKVIEQSEQGEAD